MCVHSRVPWCVLRAAEPRFPGHTQPHVPLWGELDTSLPGTWDLLNAAALDHGVSVYLWDWYWWQDAPSNPLLVRARRCMCDYASRHVCVDTSAPVAHRLCVWTCVCACLCV